MGMNEYVQFKRKIQERVETLDRLIAETERCEAVDRAATDRWRGQLGLVEAALQDSVVRIAVVGSVKSGKSTLINALLGRDLLKRGAGITTAFITRIRTDGEMGGWVELKPWDQILQELNSTVRSLPLLDGPAGSQDSSDPEQTIEYDLRRKEDRDRLRSLLERVQSEWQQTTGRLHPEFPTLKGYLDGFARLSAHMGDSINRVLFDADTLDQHQRYVSRENQAVYVRDMEIHYPVAWLGERVEIADCQGSDSPNPMHLASIQQYLLRAHLLLYVIHSRTGLREADFRLLDFIKTLRMDSQTLFVLNADLDAHPDHADLVHQEERVREELGWVVRSPRLYTFSALRQLADQLGDALPAHDGRRMALWNLEPSLVARSRDHFAAFRDDLASRIGARRARVLMGTGLSRLTVVAAGMLDTVQAQRRFLDRDLETLRAATSTLRNQHRAFLDTLHTLRHAIFGLRDALRQETAAAVTEAFDPDRSGIIREALDAVDHFDIPSRFDQDLSHPRQIFSALHRCYLEIRHALARFLVERVNLRLVALAREQEERLHEGLLKSARGFWSLFSAALEDYRREMAAFGIPVRAGAGGEPCALPASESHAMPTFDAFLDHQAISRGLLLLKFGVGRFNRFLMDLKSRMGGPEGFLTRDVQGSRSLEEAVSLLRAEAKRELLRAFAAYEKAFVGDHLFRLVDRATRNLLETFGTRLEMARIDFADLLKHGQVEGEHRAERIAVLERVAEITEAMVEELEELRCAVNLEWVPPEETASREGVRP